MTSAESFAAFSHILDGRILRALADLGFARPTLVQAKAIPLALDSRDILCRARTGSGKTAAYSIPLVQKILQAKSGDAAEDQKRHTRAIVLVPTKELCEQVTSHIKKVCKYCEDEVHPVNIAQGTPAHLQKMLLSDRPDIIVSTPSRALALLQSSSIDLPTLDTLVVDEADLILSYGHDADIRAILGGGYLPKIFQSFLMSATMTEDVEVLKGLTLRNPAILRLEEDEDEAANLVQYSVHCSETDKFLLTYVIMKLKLIRGKSIIFVNNVDRCYRLKLFLEQFSIKSCVLNSELPLNSRYHVVQEFNKGIYDYIIATDESGGRGEGDENENEEPVTQEAPDVVPPGKEPEFVDTARQDEATSDEGDGNSPDEEEPKPKATKRKRQSEPVAGPSKLAKPFKGGSTRKKAKGDREYGVTRGVDFIDVSCVLNFDLPTSATAYTHRVGRTARAGRTGMALSFVVPKDEFGKNKVVGNVPSTEHDERIFSRIETEQAARGSAIKPYAFEQRQIEAFRYRMEDALRSVTRAAIREARVKELKSEILNSDRLKAHFEDNPLDLEYLRHDKPLHPTRIQPHMKHVPKYLMPKSAPVPSIEGNKAPEGADPVLEAAGFVPFTKNGARGRGRGRGGRGGRGGGASGRGGKKKSDPLKKFGR